MRGVLGALKGSVWRPSSFWFEVGIETSVARHSACAVV
jgi:hypothetical protein